MTKSTLPFLLFTLPLLAAISPEGARTVQAVNALLDQVKLDAGPPAPGREAEARDNVTKLDGIYGQCNGQLRLLIRDRNEPEVLAARKRCEQVAASRDSLRKSLETAGQSTGQNRALTYEFVQTIIDSPALVLTGPFRALLTGVNPNAQAPPDAIKFREAMATLARIDEACRGKFRQVAGAAHPDGNRDQNPADWCAAAAKREELGKTLAMNTAAGPATGFSQSITELKTALEKREGFLTTDLTPVRRALFDRAAFVKEASEQHKDLLAAAGVPASAGLPQVLQKSIDELMAEVDRLAPRWKWPAGGPRDAAVEALGRRQVGKEYPGAVVRATVMQDPGFTIRKNRLGIPLSRDKDGFILYKMAAEKLCRQQSFKYTEVYSGAGSYQPSSGVKLNYIRFLACP